MTTLLLVLGFIGPVAAQEAADERACAVAKSELRAAVRDIHERQRNVGVASVTKLFTAVALLRANAAGTAATAWRRDDRWRLVSIPVGD